MKIFIYTMVIATAFATEVELDQVSLRETSLPDSYTFGDFFEWVKYLDLPGWGLPRYPGAI